MGNCLHHESSSSMHWSGDDWGSSTISDHDRDYYFKGMQQVLAQLMNVSDRYETNQRSWRPALQSIPEVN